MAKAARKSLPDFRTIQEAFDYCRKLDRPVRCTMGGHQIKVYPSGLLERAIHKAEVLDFKSRAAGEHDD